ncbi:MULTISPECIES: protein translocase subunit SecD [unclassified Butyrivibrio]|uniref:protein translocase subunit SecD n=1 Tax=unclassified Butyrivibrio TaxID=2639466 RepID=UPI0008E2F7DB|nr:MULTISPECIES: protein translocase subunit SecD [unclassified Butyrivibrio]RKM60875.1 protein translocase subunit SecD [Butyrivibrio sp. XB500-5]SFU31517.1 SecD/SecF fusion protein [Butyrivibrio sp. INlla21]
MKRLKWIPALIIMLALLGGIGYSAVFGLGADKSGSLSSIDLGLDLAGGVSITYEVDGEENPSKEDMADTIYKLQQRVDNYSTEAQVYQEGSNRINIEIPGVTDANTILKDLGQPGKLYFIAHLDKDGNENYTYHSGITTDEEGNMTLEEGVMPGYQLNKTIEELEAEGSIILKGENVVVSEVKAQQDQHGASEPVVSLEFNEEGKKAFAEATTKAFNNNRDTIGIYYDGRFISVPAVQAALTDGKAIITGEKTFEAAQNLASMIRIGGLKLELKELRSNVVGAQLGSEAINTSLIAAAVGFALIAIFMIVFFRILGLSATLALGFYSGLIVFLLSAFDITLTLPGIAGIILSIGMAVDANVLVFARIREEIASGKAVDEARKSGYNKALSSILDGNITTLIVAIVLRAGGTGPIKGFAETLMLGIILSMFTALVVTRVITNIFYGLGLQSPVLYGKAKPVKVFDFVGKRKLFYAISCIVIAIGIVFMAVNSSQGKGAFNYSLDFVGGTSTNVTFDKEYTVAEIENDMIPAIKEATGVKEVLHQRVSGTNQVIFKSATMDIDQRKAVEKLFEEKYGVSAENIAAETISSTISSEMRVDAVKSLLIALILMLIYIWFRFKDIKFGAAAIIALAHDALIVVVAYAISRISVGNTFIAVVLTIIGYSINDTIVTFDRIRENLHIATGKKEMAQLVNNSVSQTITRSLFTSATTFFTVLALYIFGVADIKMFALPLMVGVICGTYSSIFIASPMWFDLKTKFKTFFAKKD